MRVGVGLPTTFPDVSGRLIVDWAQSAEAQGLGSLGVLERIAYDGYDPLAALAAAAAVTSSIQLVTMIVISPLRNTALLARQSLSVHALSGGRLSLGVAVGARKDDYDAADVDFSTRGRRLAEQLVSIRDLWEQRPMEMPRDMPPTPDLLVGGGSDITFARVARYADGYVHGGGPPRAFSRAADKARAAWADAGRPGKPRLWGQGYFALGDDATIAAAIAYMREYYAFTGPYVERIVAELLTTPQSVAQFVRGYAEAGCDELVLFPAVAHPEQLVRLAAVLAG
ncbi:MAG TPA: LLM class flavin-dependent oxidoreductase [Ktedonobacterales bacterium]|jgi:alkanesulfonate monooxygenase SsuD/methylene tetrahydromethanopterin reductase-like flavin-dependent oxidoreductase (luciferase family)